MQCDLPPGALHASCVGTPPRRSAAMCAILSHSGRVMQMESPLGAPTRSGAARKLDMSAVSPFAEASGSPRVQLRFRDRHAH